MKKPVKRVGPHDSIWRLRGRLSVLSCLAHLLVVIVVGMIIPLIIAIAIGFPEPLKSSDFPQSALLALFISYSVVTTVTNYLIICLAVKRLHDRNHSGWFVLGFLLIPLVFFVPMPTALTVCLSISLFIAMLYVMLCPGQRTGNRFGAHRPTLMWEKVLGILHIVLIIASVVLAVLLGDRLTYSG